MSLSLLDIPHYLSFLHVYIAPKHCTPEPVFVNLLRSPGIDSQPGGHCDNLFVVTASQSTYRLTESIPRNRFLGSLSVYKYGLWTDNILSYLLVSAVRFYSIFCSRLTNLVTGSDRSDRSGKGGRSSYRPTTADHL